MRNGLLCSLAFVVWPALSQAQQPNYNSAWPSASAAVVQGYGYQVPSGNQAYQYPSAQYGQSQYGQAQYGAGQYGYGQAQYGQNQYGQNPYYQNQYPSQYYPNQYYSNQYQSNSTSYPSQQQPWYAQYGHANPNNAYYQALPSDGSSTSQLVPAPQLPAASDAKTAPTQPLATVPTDPIGQFGLPDMGPDPADLAMPPRSDPVDSIARRSVAGNSFWVNVNYLAGFTRPGPVRPLVTTGNVADQATPGPGAIGSPGTQVVFGQNSLQYGNPASGFKGEAGIWLDSDNRWSMDFGGFFLPRTFDRFAIASNGQGNPLIGRPFFDTSLGTQQVFLDSAPAGTFGAGSPAALIGGATSVSSQQLWGLELNGRYNTFLGRYLRAEALAGIRYLRLVEDLSVSDSVTAVVPGVLTFLGGPPLFGLPAGSTITDYDSFRASNQFTGFQVGGRLTWDFGRFFFDVNGKAAVGANQESVQINGFTTATTPVPTSVTPNLTAISPGGILAQPSNIGNHSRTTVAFVPEVGFGAGVNVTPWCRLKAGYSFLYWSDVVRPGNQINRSVNPNQVPSALGFGTTAGPSQPAFAFQQSSFWVQFINLGVEFHY